MARSCADCGVDISMRHGQAYLCVVCARTRHLAQQRRIHREMAARETEEQALRRRERQARWAREHYQKRVPEVLPCPSIACENTFLKTGNNIVCHECKLAANQYTNQVSHRNGYRKRLLKGVAA